MQTNNNNLNENNEELNTILEDINKLPSAIVKPETFTEGNIPQFDSDGNIIDSGKSVANVGGGINPNLLDNWYFINPVNRNGITTSNISGYHIDRWVYGTMLPTATISILEDGLELQNNGTENICVLTQGFIKPLPMGTYTVSVLADIIGNKSYFSLYGNDGMPINFENTYINSGLTTSTITVDENCVSSLNIRVGADNILKIKAIKLELGDAQTLAHQDVDGNWVLNEIPNYADEMAKCIQYHPTTGEYIGLPSYTYGTEDLEAGVSLLPTGMLYFQYEE